MSTVSPDVIVIGAGLAGTTVALRLAERGRSVTLLERGGLGREASGTNAGTLHFQLRRHDSHGELRTRLIAESVPEWRSLIEQYGQRLGAKMHGGCLVAEGPAQEQRLRELGGEGHRLGLKMELIVGSELRQFAPWASATITSLLFCAEEGSVNPLLTTRVLADDALAHGVDLRLGAPVEAIQRSGNGFRVQAGGQELLSSTLILAAGAWTGRLSEQLGSPLPIEGVRQIVSVTERWRAHLGPVVQHVAAPLTLKQTTDGTLLIGGGWPCELPAGDADGGARARAVAANLWQAARVVPEVGRARLVRSWAGTIAVTPDRAPYVGQLPGAPGAHVLVVPRSAAGYTVSPLLARWLAEDIVSGKETMHSLSPARAFAGVPS